MTASNSSTDSNKECMPNNKDLRILASHIHYRLGLLQPVLLLYIQMKFSVCLVLLVTVWQASAQAPGDESSGCMSQRYPPNTRMLMDSRNYDQLITGSGAVWQALDVDGTGSGVGGRITNYNFYNVILCYIL